MPLYEYRCRACEEVTEVLQKHSDPPKRKCASCGGRLEKLISRSGFVLKGSGWYVHEYGHRKGSPPSESSGEASSSDAAKTSGSAGASGAAEPAKPAKKASKRAGGSG